MNRISGILLILTAVVLAGIILPNFLPGRARTSRYEQYLCRSCAMTREVAVRQFLGTTYRSWDNVTPTVLSQGIVSRMNTACTHDWIRIYFDYHGVGESGHGGLFSRRCLTKLCESPVMASGIVGFADSEGLPLGEVWRRIIEYVETEEQADPYFRPDDALCSGMIAESGFAVWLKDHGQSVRPP